MKGLPSNTMTQSPIFNNFKTKLTNRILSLVSISNQDVISKSNTTPELAETVIVNRNSKEPSQNKVIRKELLQLKKYLNFFIKIKTKL